MATLGERVAQHRADLRAERKPPQGPPVLLAAAGVTEVLLPKQSSDPGRAQAWRTALIVPAELEKIAREREERMLALQSLVTDASEVLPLIKSGQNPSPNVCVGRAKRNDIIITDPAISSLHASFEGQGDAFVLIDHNSSNGTFVNCRRLGEGERVHLVSGDCVRFGRRVYYFLTAERLLLFLELRIVRPPAG